MFVPAFTLILALTSSAVIAVPMIDNVYKRAIDLLDPSSTEPSFYFPESVYESIPHSGAPPSPSSEKDDAKTATDYISTRLNLGTDDFKVSNSYTDPFGITHVYGTHMVNGVGVSNHQAAAHSDGKVVYTYKFQLRDDSLTRWVEVWCDTTTGEVVQAVNFANEASYKVIPLSHRDFTEGFSVAGNFQKDNFGLGGEGNDAVTINVLNPSYTNNANFITPPDGQPGVMNMFRFTDTKPSRNPGLDNAIVLHEYAAWRVYYQQPKGSPFPPIHHRYGGQPWTYGGLRTRTTTYAIGEVWASMLWEVYWNLVTKHGFATNLYDASQSAGNVVAMRIIIGGMTIHSCNPTLLGARDAIIAADNSHYQGAHKCEIYKGFAKRGLGLGATDTRTDDFSVPSECQ
ncbi:hypothetical protein BASA81_008988 [Batrachochytrium salamandrivorans]|nr:hypothetical protein BASA81_008988 [Batrachochytrium salamandrivorans]